MNRLILACILGAFAGCINTIHPVQPDAAVPKDSSTYVVCVGMENSQFAGACPGAQYDCQRMTRLLGQYTTNINSFISSQATYEKVKAALERAAQNADLFIFYYSGHGGDAKTNNLAEADGQDEFLCLWDREMLDDEVWSIISKAKGRVFLIFDCCHSATMYKLPAPMFSRGLPLQATTTVDGPISMICWSGCPDNTYSYGDANGGKLTNTILKYFNVDSSYDAIWSKVEADGSLKRFEEVQRTLMGPRFGSKKIFK